MIYESVLGQVLKGPQGAYFKDDGIGLRNKDYKKKKKSAFTLS